jgi:hypothetical protein
MKRALRIGLVLVVLLALLGGGALLFVDSLAKQAVERGGTHALGVATRLEGASIGLFSGRFGLDELAVANPPGFARPDFLVLHTARLDLPLSTLMGQRVTIPALELDGLVLDIERNASGTNYGAILAHLAGPDSATQPQGGEPADSSGGKTFVVQRLVVRGVRASVQLVPAGGDLTKLDLAVPDIVVENLASDMTLPQLCALVVRVVIQSAIRAGEGQLPAELLADLRGRVDALEDVAHAEADAHLGKLENDAREAAKKLGPEAEKAVDKASEELGKKLDGLFDKKKKKD